MHVWSRTVGGELELAPIIKVFKHLAPRHLRIELTGGRALEVTGEHPFFDPKSGNYRKAETFKAGEVVWLEDFTPKGKNKKKRPSSGRSIEIQAIKVIKGDIEVFNIEVGGNHNYFAEGILVHNK